MKFHSMSMALKTKRKGGGEEGEKEKKIWVNASSSI